MFASIPSGMNAGDGTRHGSEDCRLGRRGKPQRKSKSVREVLIAPVRGHSRKPDEVYERIEQFCAGPYLELFARHNGRDGSVSVMRPTNFTPLRRH